MHSATFVNSTSSVISANVRLEMFADSITATDEPIVISTPMVPDLALVQILFLLDCSAELFKWMSDFQRRWPHILTAIQSHYHTARIALGLVAYNREDDTTPIVDSKLFLSPSDFSIFLSELVLSPGGPESHFSSPVTGTTRNRCLKFDWSKAQPGLRKLLVHISGCGESSGTKIFTQALIGDIRYCQHCVKRNTRPDVAPAMVKLFANN